MKVIYDPPPLANSEVRIEGADQSPSAPATASAPTAPKIPNWWTHDDRWWNAKEGDLYTTPWYVRYPLGALAVYGAWWIFEEWETKKFLARWILGGGLAIIALGLMRELIFGVIVAALVGLALWAAGAAVAALPVSVAIIIGAMIIAASIKK